jgi:hypothetical protein
MLGDALHSARVAQTSETTRDFLTRQVLRQSGDFVTIVYQDENFLRLVNRRAVLERIAADAGEN